MITNNLPQVHQELNKALVKKITQEEITEVIRNLPNNKSPGIDGLSYEFYKLTEETIVPVLEKLFNRILDLGILPSSWCKNLIILSPKKSEELYNLNNWRPISLVNCDAKIFMKIIANKLNAVCNEIIPDHQQGFIVNRSITDTALDIITTMRNQKDSSKQHGILFVDQQKAFDRVNHKFLKTVLSKMNFDSKIVNLIENLFANQETHIIEGNNLSEPFKVERGI